MIIGVPRELKTHEYRVGMVPAGVPALVREGHTVLVESGAGEFAGYPDEQYREAGARLVTDIKELWGQAQLVVKVKEPQPEEYDRLRQGQILFCYLHLAPLSELTRVLMDRGVNAVGLETIQADDGHLPCLMPMSEIAGRMSIIVGANYLMSYPRGPGILLGGVPGVPPCEVLVLGAGTAGTNAARLAADQGAHVRIVDVNLDRLAYLDEIFSGRIATLMSSEDNIERYVPDADLLVGAVLVPGEKAPILVSGELVKKMRKGSVIVDIAVDQGGCIETTHPTTHDDPVYQVHGVTHYCVANMPGAVPRTSTQALTNVTFPYVKKIARLGLENSASEDPALRRGINIYTPEGESRGMVTCEGVALAHGLPYVPCEKAVAGLWVS
jgi:alanine dehydrogenase